MRNSLYTQPTYCMGDFIENNEDVKTGDVVNVRWGYGLDFRAEGTGVVVKVNRKSVQVRLTANVMHRDSIGWPEGFVLKGTPRAIFGDFGARWNIWNSFEIVAN